MLGITSLMMPSFFPDISDISDVRSEIDMTSSPFFNVTLFNSAPVIVPFCIAQLLKV